MPVITKAAEAGEGTTAASRLDQGLHVPERPDADVLGVHHVAESGPGRGQLVDDQPVVGWQVAHRDIAAGIRALKEERLALRVAGHQPAVAKPDYRSGSLVVPAVGPQPPINR